MKSLLILVGMFLLVSCSSKEVKPPVIVKPPVVDPTPVPLTGKWCPSGKPDFSPCNPGGPDMALACKVGEDFVGCKSVICKNSSDACAIAFTAEGAVEYGRMTSRQVRITFLDGHAVLYPRPIMPSPEPPPMPAMEVVEKVDGFYLK